MSSTEHVKTLQRCVLKEDETRLFRLECVLCCSAEIIAFVLHINLVDCVASKLSKMAD